MFLIIEGLWHIFEPHYLMPESGGGSGAMA
jgi:hypothetical protein